MNSQRLLLIGLLIQLGVMASIASVLVRSVAFKRYLYRDDRTLRDQFILVLFLTFPLAAGVIIRILVPSFSPADLSLQGALLIGLIAGEFAGILGGAMIATPALLWAHEWLSLPLIAGAGLIGGVLRHAAPNQEEVWAFSPFIDLELWRWLRNRLDRPFRDWQALVFAVVLLLTLVQLEVIHLFPHRVYGPAAHSGWDVVAVFAMNILALAIPIKIWNNTRIEMKLEEQHRRLVQARLDALTSQINPHFLFNTLNSVASLVRFDPDTARLLIVKLSNILRRLLKKHENYVPLREELAFIDDYLDIEVVRFGPEKLRVEKMIDPQVLDAMVPSMLLQPIVENSIRHGLSPKIDGGRIVVRGRRQGDRVLIDIEDDGVGIPLERRDDPTHQGIGMANVRERLRVLYGDMASFAVISEIGEGTCIHIEIPDLYAAEASSSRLI